jgi:hypothetical protein
LVQEAAAVQACGVNLALWAAFQVLDEVVLAYQPEAVHRVIFLSQLATLLVLHLPPGTTGRPGNLAGGGAPAVAPADLPSNPATTGTATRRGSV